MKLFLNKILFLFFVLIINACVFSQKKQVMINNHKFEIVNNLVDTSEGGREEILALYRNHRKILSHTILAQIGDCSSISVEIGSYKIENNSITFYSYWATTDRMPSLAVPFGFRKQIYSVDKNGKLALLKSQIYIKDYVERDQRNEKFYEQGDRWKHIGLNFLNHFPESRFEKNAVADYIKNIEQKYNSKFVSGPEKAALETEVRNRMKNEIAKNTEDWVEGEIYGRVKK